ncbi:MAG: hypothetical protein IK059_01995 [Firmicutes bacterium]|nr:hypothetical protein [Bacillota bacterium]
MRENFSEETLRQISAVREDFKNDSLLDIQKYYEAFEVFFHCYLEGEESVADFFADRWAESCDKLEVKASDLPLKPLIISEHYGEVGEGFNTVLCTLPRAVSCDESTVNMFMVFFRDAMVPPVIFLAEQGGEGMEGDDIRIVELRPRPLESDTDEHYMGQKIINHGCIKSRGPKLEASDFYNAVLGIICTLSKSVKGILEAETHTEVKRVS